MGLVDREEPRPGPLERVEDPVVGELLGGEEHELQLPCGEAAQDVRALVPARRGVEHRGREVEVRARGEGGQLVVLEGDQRADDDGGPVEQQGRHLVDRRLPAARRHHHDCVAALQQRGHRHQLVRSQARPPEVPPGGRLQPLGRVGRARCAHPPTLDIDPGAAHPGSVGRPVTRSGGVPRPVAPSWDGAAGTGAHGRHERGPTWCSTR